MVITSFGHVFIVLQLQFQLHVLFLSSCQLLGQLMDFLEQFLKTLLIVFFDFYLYLFVTACRLRSEVIQCFWVNPSLEVRDIDGFKCLDWFFWYHSRCLISWCRISFISILGCLFSGWGLLWLFSLNNYWLLNAQLGSCLFGDWLVKLDLHIRTGMRCLILVQVLISSSHILRESLLKNSHFILEFSRHSNSLV